MADFRGARSGPNRSRQAAATCRNVFAVSSSSTYARISASIESLPGRPQRCSPRQAAREFTYGLCIGQLSRPRRSVLRAVCGLGFSVLIHLEQDCNSLAGAPPFKKTQVRNVEVLFEPTPEAQVVIIAAV